MRAENLRGGMGSNSARLDALERAVARRWIELDELKISLDALEANVAAAKRDVAEARTVLEDDKAHLSTPTLGAADHAVREGGVAHYLRFTVL